jgi:ubiquinone/menaquinone biosynthesis C-methylase UbiE
MRLGWLIAAGLALASCQPPPQDLAPAAAVAPVPASAKQPPPRDPPGFYLGRRIAPTMSHEGAEWLTRPEREAEEHSARMLRELGLRPGDVACDVGAGNGYHTLEMARTVAPGGRAIAVDIQPEMLALLRQRARAAKLANVETILGGQADPKLPRGVCDLVLLADVYHELDQPSEMLRHLRRALSARGVLVLLEFRAEDPDVPIDPEHKMTRAQILRELGANGFEVVRSFEGLPWQHLMFFAPAER